MTTDKTLAIVSAVTVGALSIILIGGSVAAVLVGRDIPQWMTLADGAIITAAFGTGAFFGLARAAIPTAQALQTTLEMHHELAMAGLTSSTPTGQVNTSHQPIVSGDGTLSPTPTPTPDASHTGGE